MRSHPDRNGGRDEEFNRVRDAYELLLMDLAQAEPSPPAAEEPPQEVDAGDTPRPRKPEVLTRFVPLSAEAIAACRARLAPELSATGGAAARPARPVPARADAAEHVPVAVAMRGRTLTYQIATPLVRGVNRVSLPTALLHDRSLENPQIVTFRSRSSGRGEIVAPDGIRESLFPGARSVHIRFQVA